MRYKKWDSKTKFQVVLEGLKSGASVADICNRYQVSQSQYYQWRDQFLEQGRTVFDGGSDQERERLKKEVTKLKTIIGDLTTELKKNDYD